MALVDPDGASWFSAAMGFLNAFGSNFLSGARRQTNSIDRDYVNGQRAGDVASMIAGAAEAAAGIAGVITGTGGGLLLAPATGGASAIAGAALVAGGLAATQQGVDVSLSAGKNLGRGGGAGKSSDSPTVGDKIDGVGVSSHAADQARVRGVSSDQIELALQKGRPYYDTKNDSVLWVVGENGRGGYSVATTADRQTIKTVQNFIPNLSPGDGTRFIKINP